MKKILYICLLGLCVCSCKHNLDTNKFDNITSLAQITTGDIQTDSIVIMDSMRQYGIMSKVKVEAEFPVGGNFFLVNSIREWMTEELGGTFTGTPDNGKAMLTHYAQQVLKDLNDLTEDCDWMDSTSREEMVFDTEIQLSKIFENDQFVTYQYHNIGYSGGAHGWNLAYGQTFRKSDGRRIDYSFFQNDKQFKLTQLVQQNIIKQYFEGDSSAFNNGLTLDPYETFPLPVNPPYFTKDGVAFIYQQYEIAAYAIGMPSCDIPYSTIEPYLTQTGKQLIHMGNIATK